MECSKKNVTLILMIILIGKKDIFSGKLTEIHKVLVTLVTLTFSSAWPLLNAFIACSNI